MTTADDPNSKIERPELGVAGGDVTAAAVRSVIANIPFVGQALTEIITVLIPNQRSDRVDQYLHYLTEELARLKIDQEAMKRPENIDLLEDGAYQAARALTAQRRRYLAHAVAQGIAADDNDKLNEKRILALIGELDDGDIILLDAYNSTPESKAAKFNLIRPDQPVIGDDPIFHTKWGLYEASTSKLNRLSLLRKNITVDHDTKTPEFDMFSGEPRGFQQITVLGGSYLIALDWSQVSKAGAVQPAADARMPTLTRRRVCEDHPDTPWEGDHACTCGGGCCPN